MSDSKTYKDELSEFLSDPENLKLFQREQLIHDVTQLIYEVMEEGGISKSELARRLGKSASFVTQALDGDRNMTLRTVSDLFTALGREPFLAARPLGGARRPEGVCFFYAGSQEYEWPSLEEHEVLVCSTQARDQVAA